MKALQSQAVCTFDYVASTNELGLQLTDLLTATSVGLHDICLTYPSAT